MDIAHLRRIGIAGAVALGSAFAVVPAQAHAVITRTLCVGSAPGCSSSLSTVVGSARDGDAIRVGPGVFRGGITIDKSLTIIGAGEGRTVITGGGPVVTIAQGSNAKVPVVSISDLSVSGGTAVGNGFTSRGGGLDIEPAADGGVGAAVTLTGVVVAHNRATATTTSPSPSGVLCPNGFCPFALGQGGGIANSGRLTLVKSSVLDNAADGVLSDADGAGIYSELGSLTLRSTLVAGNAAEPKSIGRFAEGGGIFAQSGDVTVADSTITGNHADLVTTWPARGQGTLIDMNANSGGIHIGDGVNTVIDNTTISGNSISALDRNGEPLAFDAAMLVGDSQITISGTRFDHNSVTADVATTEDVGPSGTIVEFDGPAHVTQSSITNNTVNVTAQDGTAGASGGLAVFDFSDNPRQVTVSGSIISGNRALAYSPRGSASITGVGILNNSLLELDRVTVRDNIGTASGSSATAQGGGIWNGPLLSGPPVVLTLRQSAITADSVSAGPHGQATGGGIYTTTPVTVDHTVIVANHPDNCTGC
jgi:hypothetical protein